MNEASTTDVPTDPLRRAFVGAALADSAEQKLEAIRVAAVELAPRIWWGDVDLFDAEERLLDLAHSHGLFDLLTRGACEAVIATALRKPALEDVTPRSDVRASMATTRPRRRNGAVAAEAAGQLPLPFQFTLARDIKFEPKEFIVEDIAGVGETSGWYGAPDLGKSTVIVDVGCHVAAERVYCGKAVRRGSVLYLAPERAAVTRRRVRAWMHHKGIDDLPLAVVDAGIDLRTGEIHAKRIIATAKELERLTGIAVVLIIIDTLNRVLAGGDENSSKDMGALIFQMAAIQRETKAHLAFLHHVPVDRADRMRGHGSVEAAFDVTVSVAKDGEDVVTVMVDKGNDLVTKPAFRFAFVSVSLGMDTTGKETTAPVLNWLENETVAKEKRGRVIRTSKADRAFRSAFTEAIDGGNIRVINGCRAVPLLDVKAQFDRTYPTAEADPTKRTDAIRIAFRRYLQSLPSDFATQVAEGREYIWSTK